jgi:hypothetical protein
MGDHKPETVAYLTQGFQEGFKPHIEDASMAQFRTLAKILRENRDLGHTAPRQSLGGTMFVAHPVRAEPKRDGGVDIPSKYRYACPKSVERW